jgi:hypothetical protein
MQKLLPHGPLHLTHLTFPVIVLPQLATEHFFAGMIMVLINVVQNKLKGKS